MILVTGGTGLVGSHLLYKLAIANEKIRAVVRDKAKIKLASKIFSYYADNADELIKKIEWFYADMLDPVSLNAAFDDVDKVYHCAAMVAIGGKNDSKIIENNVIGTEHIVNLCIEKNVKKLCHVSSVAALGHAKNGEIIDENTRWSNSKNGSAYSMSKYKSEMEVWRGIQEGLNAVIINPSVILGPGIWNSGSGALFSKAAKGMKFYTEGLTGFVDVRDVADSMIQLMESDISNERFVINSENIAYKKLFDLIAENMSVKKPSVKATRALLIMAFILDKTASILRIKKQEITKDVIRGGNSKSSYSNEKIIQQIGKSFIPINQSIGFIASKYKNELTIN